MKWYGRYIYKFLNKTNRIKRRNLVKSKYLTKPLISKINNNPFTFNLYVPDMWKFIILRKTANPVSNSSYTMIYFFSNFYYFYLPISDYFLTLKIDRCSNVINFNFFYKNNFYGSFWSFFTKVFSQFSLVFFKKLKFKGKGYYIYKNSRNTIALQFGYSHRCYLYTFFTNVKFISKTSILMFGINKSNIEHASKSLFLIRPINIFTGKGIRFSKQIVYKKTGKISSYR